MYSIQGRPLSWCASSMYPVLLPAVPQCFCFCYSKIAAGEVEIPGCGLSAGTSKARHRPTGRDVHSDRHTQYFVDGLRTVQVHLKYPSFHFIPVRPETRLRDPSSRRRTASGGMRRVKPSSCGYQTRNGQEMRSCLVLRHTITASSPRVPRQICCASPISLF